MKYNFAHLILSLTVLAGQGASAHRVHAQGSLTPPGGIEPIPAEADTLPGFLPADPELREGDAVPGIPDPTLDYDQDGAPRAADPNAIERFVPGQTERYIECQPALLESSGSWLRRGFWYAETDAVLFNRLWNPDRIRLVTEQTGQTQLPLLNVGIPVSNELNIDEQGEVEGMPRLTLGRFLFRDSSNRDHLAEFTWFGGGEWTQQGSLQAVDGGNGLQVPVAVDGSNAGGNAPANPSFDGARASDYRYDSHLDSVELNYFVRQRMNRDQMILKPDGTWVRRATPTRTLGFLAGIRYLNIREALAWNASGIPDGDADGALETGRYFVATDNNLIGTQLGFSAAHEASRWSLGLETKFGGYWNAMDLNSALDISGGVANARSNPTNDTLALVAEASLTGRWHLTPRWSIRTGFEVLWVERLALAPHQLNFVPGGYDFIVDTGGEVMLGTSLGVESYW